MPDTPGPGPDHAAWHAFCDALKEAGDRILAPDFPTAPEDRAEGFRHLAQQAVCWLTWGVGHLDPQDPRFMRQNDLLTRWGGPNVDNVYKHARIDDTGTYRIRGLMHSCEEFLLALRIGNMHQERYGTLHEVTATDLGIGPGEAFELILGGPEPAAPDARGDLDGDPETTSGAASGAAPGTPAVRRIPLPPGTRVVAIREYYYDWRESEPAVFTIERLDTQDSGTPRPPARLTPARMAGQLDEARSQFERSITYWNDYQRAARGRGDDNTFIQPRAEPKGLKGLVYGFCFYRLAPGEALVVECEAPIARYWSYQLYQLGWFEPVESIHRTGGLNHRQAAVDADGRVRVVVAHTDPGIANWLDTEGRPEGMLTFRCAWSDNRPEPSARVVRLDELADALGPDDAGGPVSADQRRTHLATRRANAAWRFRT